MVRIRLPPAESRANHRFQPPVVKRLGEDETLVALRRDFRTSLAIAADALGTEIGQKRARFAWDVGPGVGVWCRKRGAFGTCFALTSPRNPGFRTGRPRGALWKSAPGCAAWVWVTRPRSRRASTRGICALAWPAGSSASATRSVRAQHSRGASSTASRPNRRCPKPRWCDDAGFDATAGAPGAPAAGGPGADDQRTRTAVLSTAFGAGKSTGREAPAERLDRCVGDVHRSRHGDHGRTDRHQLIDPDPRRAVGQLRRDRLLQPRPGPWPLRCLLCKSGFTAAAGARLPKRS